MSCRVARSRHEAPVAQVVQLHHDALAYRSFVAGFGLPFLRELYAGLLDLELAFLVVAEEGPRVDGFALVTVEPGALLQVARRRWARLVGPVLRRLLRSPRTLRRLVETLAYPARVRSTTGAEVVAIAVREGARSRGLGKALVRAAEAELTRRRGSPGFKVTVHEAMDGANAFYRGLGLRVVQQFRMYGVAWNVYERSDSGA